MSNVGTLTVCVASKTMETPEICLFDLVAAQGAALPAFSAGAHVDVHLPGGLTRQYSLCNDPRETHRYQIAVLLDAKTRGGSAALHAQVQQGDLLEISAPKNHFALAHEGRHNLLLAGGIGVTPILCMAERLANAGADFALHYCTRSPERTAFRTRIAASNFAAKVQFHYDDGPDAQKLDLATLLAQPQNGTHLYVCGPKGFMDAALGMAREKGWPESQLHYEFFSAEVAKSESDAGFEIKLASSGRIVMVSKEQTVVQALSAVGVEIMTACEQGVCGTCITRVLEGRPDHKDSYLTPEERSTNDQFLPCCSRSQTPQLVLDL